VNAGGFNSFLDCYSAVDRYIGYISVASLGFIPNELGLDLVIFILSVDGVLIASWASI
jgi:hypothetical protein